MGEASNIVNNLKVETVILNCGSYNNMEKELIKQLNKKNIEYYTCINKLNVKDIKLYFLSKTCKKLIITRRIKWKEYSKLTENKKNLLKNVELVVLWNVWYTINNINGKIAWIIVGIFNNSVNQKKEVIGCILFLL